MSVPPVRQAGYPAPLPPVKTDRVQVQKVQTADHAQTEYDVPMADLRVLVPGGYLLQSRQVVLIIQFGVSSDDRSLLWGRSRVGARPGPRHASEGRRRCTQCRGPAPSDHEAHRRPAGGEKGKRGTGEADPGGPRRHSVARRRWEFQRITRVRHPWPGNMVEIDELSPCIVHIPQPTAHTSPHSPHSFGQGSGRGRMLHLGSGPLHPTWGVSGSSPQPQLPFARGGGADGDAVQKKWLGNSSGWSLIIRLKLLGRKM